MSSTRVKGVERYGLHLSPDHDCYQREGCKADTGNQILEEGKAFELGEHCSMASLEIDRLMRDPFSWPSMAS